MMLQRSFNCLSQRLGPCLIHEISCIQRMTVSHHQQRDITIDVHMNTTSGKNQNNNNNKRKKKQKRDSGRASYRFVDRTRVRVSGGSGGNGSKSMFRIGRKHKRRPDGGHGGNGGSIVIVADQNEQSLRWTTPHVTADSGTHGSSQCKNGKNANNKVLKVPCGVVVRRVLDYDEQWDSQSKTVIKIQPQATTDEGSDINISDYDDDDDHYDNADRDHFGKETNDHTYFVGKTLEDINDDHSYQTPLGEEKDLPVDEELIEEDLIDFTFTPWGEREKVDIADLDTHGSYAVVAKGGKGGTGSSIFASRHGPLPNPEELAEYAKPKEGETAFLELELKLIADIGLVGFPNAGKSSLLAAMSRATPHIAPYPFTTLNPLVGYIEYTDGFKVCVADVPGLIEGASSGRGKGHDFLRHLERTKALLFIVDAAGVDGRDPVSDFQILTEELGAYGDGDMLNRRSLLVANKIDLLDQKAQDEIQLNLKAVAQECGVTIDGDIITCSVGVTGEGLSSLSRAMRRIVDLNEAERI